MSTTKYRKGTVSYESEEIGIGGIFIFIIIIIVLALINPIAAMLVFIIILGFYMMNKVGFIEDIQSKFIVNLIKEEGKVEIGKLSRIIDVPIRELTRLISRIRTPHLSIVMEGDKQYVTTINVNNNSQLPTNQPIKESTALASNVSGSTLSAEAGQQNIVCQYCGTILPPNAKFCYNCGASVQ